MPNGENCYKISGNAESCLFHQAVHVERCKYNYFFLKLPNFISNWKNYSCNQRFSKFFRDFVTFTQGQLSKSGGHKAKFSPLFRKFTFHCILTILGISKVRGTQPCHHDGRTPTVMKLLLSQNFCQKIDQNFMKVHPHSVEITEM